MALDYRSSGVSIEAGDALVERIKPLAAATRTPECLTGIGGFAALCGLPGGLKDPVLVSGTDGVGTKLYVAQAANRHDTVGVDLVAMCVNDILTTGARPLFFLDYLSTPALDVPQATDVVRGIAEGCRQAGCALLGGETAEHPGSGHQGYDLAGFAVGVVERADILPRQSISAGDVVLGVASSGLHSNGYSLARKVCFEVAGLSLDDVPEALGEPLVDALLRPTRIYGRAVQAALSAGGVKGLCHVTGGGLPGNLPRILPEGLGAELDVARWQPAPIFDWLQGLGGIERREMFRAFNMGLGMVIVVSADCAEAVEAAVTAAGEQVTTVGQVIAMPGVGGEERVRIADTQ